MEQPAHPAQSGAAGTDTQGRRRRAGPLARLDRIPVWPYERKLLWIVGAGYFFALCGDRICRVWRVTSPVSSAVAKSVGERAGHGRVPAGGFSRYPYPLGPITRRLHLCRSKYAHRSLPRPR